MSDDAPRLIAYRVGDADRMPLVPAPSTRPWMDATHQRFAYRCLPMVIANQAGWIIQNSHTFTAVWDGSMAVDGVRVEALSGAGPCPASGHFGSGVITFTLPYLFQTSPGYALLMRGASNWPKDGASPLEGLIETDWSPATATMNWKLTRPGLTVRFDVGDPVCMVVPVRLDTLEAVAPALVEFAEAGALATQHQVWAESRRRFLAGDRTDVEGPGDGWQKHYFQGTSPGGVEAPEHRRALRLRPFRAPGEDERATEDDITRDR